MTLYGEEFYGWQAAGAERSAAAVAPLLNDLIGPTAVLDLGGGVGCWATQWSRSVCVDGDYVPRDKLLISEPQFVAHDLTTPLDLHRYFDMAICVEVAEHLPATAAETLIYTLCSHTDVVVWSAAIPGQGGVGHINEQPPAYWANLFAAHGFKPYDLLRKAIWDDQRIEWWYRQNLLVYATDPVAEEHEWTSHLPEITTHPDAA